MPARRLTIPDMKFHEAIVDPAHSWPERGVSILNGMFGDYLQRRGNDLAIDMTFRQHGLPLDLNAESLRGAYPTLTRKLCILVHGFCCNESVWTFATTATDPEGGSYGTRLQRDGGYTSFNVRYNSGMPIAVNGGHLAKLVSHLVASYPIVVDEITLIGHSMGGLVIRSACDPARPDTENWLAQVKRVIYLGTPHDGADLERFAHLTTGTLQAIPSLVTRLVGDVLNLRSRGTKDLRHGQPLSDGEPLPWLPTARHYLLMGTLTKDPEHPIGRVFGDALVRVPAIQPEADGTPAAPDVVVFPGVHHLALAHDASVYQCIRQICKGD